MSTTEIVPEVDINDPTFTHKLIDGVTITVGKPVGIIRVKLRALLDDYIKDTEFTEIGRAFLSIRRWDGGPPSPLGSKGQFLGMLARFKSEDDLDEFMEKWQKLTMPEATRIAATAVLEAMEAGMSEDATREHIRQATLPLAREKLERLRD
jgi:hypothetical protein